MRAIVKILIFVSIIVVSIIVTSCLEIYKHYKASVLCPNSCFIKNNETWCDHDCWDIMKEYNVEPNPTHTECEMWGFGYGCD